MKKNIQDVVRYNLCTGCGTCFSLCPGEAIELKIDKRTGTYVPLIDATRCNFCGLCFDSCPGHGVDLEGLNRTLFGKPPEDWRLGNVKEIYLGYSRDYAIRYSAASGGLVTSLILAALENNTINGALVTGMKTRTPWEPNPFIARTPEEVLASARSKYCPVPLNKGLREIMKTDGRYAVVGLPCHIHGLRKAQEKNKVLRQRIVFAIGLFCGSGRSFKALEFMLSRLNLTLEQVSDIQYRGDGWPGKLRIATTDGRTITAHLRDYYPLLCYHDPHRCSLCPDKFAELADISCGDAWLSSISKKNEPGMSIVVARTDRADRFLHGLSPGRVVLRDLSCEEFLRETEYEGKKRTIGARRLLCLATGKRVPSINCVLLPWTYRDIFRAVRHYVVQWICRRKLGQKLFFSVRKRHRTMRYELERDTLAFENTPK